MKVLLYHRNFPGPGGPFLGGIAKAVAGLADGMAREGAQVTVLTERERAAVREAPYGMRRTSRGEILRSQYSATSLVRLLEEYKDDGFVILNGIFHTGVLLLSRLCRRLAVPHAIAPHDPYNPEQFRGGRVRKRLYFKLFERGVLQGAQAVQLLDPGHAEYLRALGVRTPVLSAPNGYDSQDVPEEDVLAWSTVGPVRVLYLGRMDIHNKGLDLLVDAVSAVGDRLDLAVTLQGPDHGDRARLEKLVQDRGLSHRMEIRNPDYRRTSCELVSEHDVLCLPSRFEGFGLAALEAMTAARVAIVTDVAGVARHIKTSGGGVVTQADAPSIAAALVDLVGRRSDWRSMGLGARRYVLEHLTWGAAAGHLLDGYRAIAHLSAHSLSTSSYAPAVDPSRSNPAG